MAHRGLIPALAITVLGGSSLLAASSALGEGGEPAPTWPHPIEAPAAGPAQSPPIFSDDGAAASAAPIAAAEADRILAEAEAALAGETGPREPTIALAAVAEALPRLDGRQEARAERILARPTQGARDPDGFGYSAPARSAFSRHFCYFWVERGRDAVPAADSDGDNIPNFVESMARSAETSFTVEHGRLNFDRPVSDGRRGCRPGRIDIYAKELNGTYGVAVPEPTRTGRHWPAYMLVDRNMVEFGYPSFGPPLAATVAHEYNHVIQNRYDAIQDPWMFESTATWTEEKVFPAVNDYLNYLSAYQAVGVPLTSNDHIKQYASAVWNLFLESRFRVRTIEKAWSFSLLTRPKEFAPAAFERAIRGASRGRSSFAEEFAAFAAAVAEWRAKDIFPDNDRYPDIRRSGRLNAGGNLKRLALDHTTYRFLDVRDRRGKVKLVMRAPRGISAALALVGRIGPERTGRVVTRVKVLPGGGTGRLSLPAANRYQRITAVIVNSDYDQAGYDNSFGDWIFTGNNAVFRVGLAR